jgi:membrane-associated phospholipid phosphatase
MEDDALLGANASAEYGAASAMGAHSPPVFVGEKEGLREKKSEWGPPADARCVVRFPRALEECLAHVDDPIIALCQLCEDDAASPPLRFAAAGCRVLSRVITFFTAIEIGVSVPLILYFCGQDGEASWFATLMLVTGAATQVPKRFIWRARPFHVNRARSTLRNATSSFPSRAVACSTIYAYLVAYTLVYPAESALHASLLWLAIAAVLVPLAAFARINLGVHYPSDTVAGAILGVAICVAGTALSWVEDLGCASCRTGECYATAAAAGDEGAGDAISWSAMASVSWGLVAACALASLALTLVAIAPPLRFWNKCAHVGGVTLGCLSFHLTFLCKQASANGRHALPPPDALRGAATQIGALAAAFVLSSALFALGKVAQSKAVSKALGRAIIVADLTLFAGEFSVMYRYILRDHAHNLTRSP